MRVLALAAVFVIEDESAEEGKGKLLLCPGRRELRELAREFRLRLDKQRQ